MKDKYQIPVKCDNCGTFYIAKIWQGTLVASEKCEKCGCKELFATDPAIITLTTKSGGDK